VKSEELKCPIIVLPADFIPISFGDFYTSRLWIHVDITNRKQWEG